MLVNAYNEPYCKVLPVIFSFCAPCGTIF